MFQSRTHTCGELRKEHAGQQVTIVGWMENVREVGSSLAFVVVRDFYGITQVVIETEELMAVVKDINKESTISVTGLVRERSNVNHKIPPERSKWYPARSGFWDGAPIRNCPSRSGIPGMQMSPCVSDTAIWI